MFVLVATAYAAVELKGLAESGSGARMLAMDVHKWAGMLVLLLAVPRLGWRLVAGAPAPEPGPAWMARLGRAMHVLLYLFLFAQPLVGLLALNAGGHALIVPGTDFPIPALIAPSPDIRTLLKTGHAWTGNGFYTLIGLHALASLFHHYMLGDDTLRRMWR